MCDGKTTRHFDQTATRLARLGGNGCLYPSVVMYLSERHGHPEGRSGCRDGGVEHCGGRCVRVKDDGDPRDPRRNLLEQLQPFRIQRRIRRAEPGYVAAGPCEALNKALPDGIAHAHEDDRYRGRLLPQRRDHRRALCEDCVLRQPDQCCRIGLEESWIACSKAIIDPDILTLNPPETPQCLRKGCHV